MAFEHTFAQRRDQEILKDQKNPGKSQKELETAL